MPEEIFKNCQIDFSKLITYGFQKEENNYVYQTTIINDTFSLKVIITELQKVTVEVYDLMTNFPYTNYRVEKETGSFVTKVREEIKETLLDIKEKCATTSYFETAQANRITKKLIDKYHSYPDFAWPKYPHYAVFRNPQNQKWYGIIMKIKGEKLKAEKGEVEILNVKLAPEKVTQYLSYQGFYPAYHMNKKNWLSIILDETISDELILSLITESFEFTSTTTAWLVPANPKYYDLQKHFKKTPIITWKKAKEATLGDEIYIYMAKPYSAILYQCEVIKLKEDEMQLKLIKEYDPKKYTLENMKKFGLKPVRSIRKINEKLCQKLAE